MMTRNVTLTLDKAKEWFNSGCAGLKEVALQAFTEKELTTPHFEDIRTFEDAMDALGWHLKYKSFIRNHIKKVSTYSLASAAMMKLNIIRKALNLGENMKLTEGDIYYPYTPFIGESSTYYNSEIKKGSMSVVAKFKHNGKEYRLVGGSAHAGSDAGLSVFYSTNSVGHSHATVGFLGCATREIAEHFGKYFAKEIFDAKYGDTVEYQWLD